MSSSSWASNSVQKILILRAGDLVIRLVFIDLSPGKDPVLLILIRPKITKYKPDVQTQFNQTLEVQLPPLLHGVEVVGDGGGLGLRDAPGFQHVPPIALLSVQGQPRIRLVCD